MKVKCDNKWLGSVGLREQVRRKKKTEVAGKEARYQHE